MQDDAPGVVDLFHITGGVAHEKRHDPQAGRKGLVQPAVMGRW
jgi:hypothetical protein